MRLGNAEEIAVLRERRALSEIQRGVLDALGAFQREGNVVFVVLFGQLGNDVRPLFLRKCRSGHGKIEREFQVGIAVPDQLLPAWEALHDAVMLRFRAVGDGEMLNDVIGFVRKTYTCDALPVQEVVQSDRPLGQKGRAHKKGGRKKKDSSHNQFVLAADAGGKSEGTEKVQRGLLFIFGRRCK